MGGEENCCPTRRASISGRCDSRGPGANMRTQSLRVCFCYKGGFQKELQLFVSSDCSLWKSAVTQPVLQQGLCATGSCSLLAGPSELLGCSQACSAMALGASGCVRVRNGGSLFCFGAAWSSGLHSLAAQCSLGLQIQQRCWFTAHLTGGPRHQEQQVTQSK